MKGVEREKGLSFFRYLFAEVSHGYLLEEDDQMYSEKQRRVSTFMKAPRELEKVLLPLLILVSEDVELMLFGFFICLDAFLFLVTFLPVRILLALLMVSFRVITCSWQRLLDQAQKIDMIRVCILILCSVAMGYIDISSLYHLIRGQSVIKLYVIYNMLEIVDRLLASIGQDTLDSLFWLASEKRRKKREHLETLFYFCFAVFYVFLHTNVILIQAITLNVAINSYSKVLLTIMMSNNFVELKGSVFKKFEINNLFQISCSDIRERFHYLVLLSVVIILNLNQFEWDLAYMETIIPIILVVFFSEIFVDWVKHAFITKFNDINSDVYKKYRAILAKDLVTSRQKNAKSDHFDQVSRRMGFIPLPLSCLVWKTLSQSLKFPGLTGAILVVVVYLCLTALKIFLGIVLLGKACQYRATPPNTPDQVRKASSTSQTSDTTGSETLRHRGTKSSTSSSSSRSSVDLIDTVSEPTLPGTPKGASIKPKMKAKSLSEIERFTLCSNRIV